MDMIDSWFYNNIYKIVFEPMETSDFQNMNPHIVYYTEW